MTPPGIGTQAYFQHYYGSRDWSAYSDLLSVVVARGGEGPILDVGAGTGLFVEAARRRGLTCVGLEGSPDAINIAATRAPGLTLVHHYLPAPFPFRDATFQATVLNQVIEHLEVPVASAALDECTRVLRPGGLLLVTSPSRFNRREWRADPTHLHLYGPSELRRLIAAKGFERITAMDHPLPLLGPSLLGRGLMRLLFTVSRWERLSASASCYAFKPSGQVVPR